jgi:hypothetical protein
VNDGTLLSSEGEGPRVSHTVPLVAYALMWQVAIPRFSKYCWW